MLTTTLVTPEDQQRLAGYLEQANRGEISKDLSFQTEGLTLLSEAFKFNGEIVFKRNYCR